MWERVSGREVTTGVEETWGEDAACHTARMLKYFSLPRFVTSFDSRLADFGLPQRVKGSGLECDGLGVSVVREVCGQRIYFLR